MLAKNLNSPLYCVILWKNKNWKSYGRKKTKITKQSHPYKSYANSYSVEILDSFNHELQLKDIDYAIINKVINLLTELKRLN